MRRGAAEGKERARGARNGEGEKGSGEDDGVYECTGQGPGIQLSDLYSDRGLRESQGLNGQICSLHRQKSQWLGVTEAEKCSNMWPSLSVHESVSAGGQSDTSWASKWPQMVAPLKAMAL